MGNERFIRNGSIGRWCRQGGCHNLIAKAALLPYQCLRPVRTKRAVYSCRSSRRTRSDPQPDGTARPASCGPSLSFYVSRRVSLRRASCARHPGKRKDGKVVIKCVGIKIKKSARDNVATMLAIISFLNSIANNN